MYFSERLCRVLDVFTRAIDALVISLQLRLAVGGPPELPHRLRLDLQPRHLKIRVYRYLRCRTQFTAPYESGDPSDTKEHL
jgi:hypothetical protein